MPENPSSSTELFAFLAKKKAPFSVQIELTHRCVFRCVHCYLPMRARIAKRSDVTQFELSTAQWISLIDELRQLGTMFLILTGGEVFYRHDFFDIANYAKEQGFALRVFTSGYPIDEDVADKLCKLQPYDVQVSLYGASAETYKAVTGLDDGYDRVMTGLALLKERHVRFLIKAPLLKPNYREAAMMASIARHFEVPFRHDLIIVPGIDGSDYPLRHRLSEAQMTHALQELYPDGIEPPAQKDPFAPGCGAGRYAATIGPFGDVYPCVEWRESSGSIKDRPFAKIWHDGASLTEARETENQRQAHPNKVFSDWALGHCAALSRNTSGSAYAPNDEHLKAARARHAVARSCDCSANSIDEESLEV